MSPVLHENQTRVKIRRVFFTGTTALSEGQAVCYERAAVDTATGTTATDAWAKRDLRVGLPANTNNLAFAGVACRAYAADAGGQWIEIYEPGSVCFVLLAANKAIGQNVYATMIVGGTSAGKFGAAGFMGRGTVRILQTIDGSSTAALCLAELLDGPESGGVETLTPVAAGGAITPMVGGVTLINGGTVNDAHCTYTLPDGVYIGQRKFFKITTLVGNSKNVVVSLATAGVQMDGSTALVSMTFNAADEQSLVEWVGAKFKLVASFGTTLASS